MAAPSSRDRHWVLPNRNFLGLLAVLAAMWYAGASQNNGAAYLLCFVLAGVALVSALHTRANLRGIAIEADAIRPAFAGESLVVALRIRSGLRRACFAVRVSASNAEHAAFFRQIPPAGTEGGELRLRATQRGSFETLSIVIESRFPLGFLTARRTVVLDRPHLIYPAPIGARALPISLQPARHARDGLRAEGDDFGGVRAWRTGESQRHIDWKAAARGQPLLVKQWTGDADQTLMLDWEILPGMETEARLSQLARWIVLAERGGARYGLAIPGTTLDPSRGDAHYHACLRALALFEGGTRNAPAASAPEKSPALKS